MIKTLNHLKLCECGCEVIMFSKNKQGRNMRYLFNHHNNVPEVKEKIRKSNIGKKATTETIKKLIKSHLGNKSHLGFKRTLESKKKQSDKMIQFYIDHPENRKIISKLKMGNKNVLGRKMRAEEIERMKIRRMNQILPKKDSKPEIMLQLLLDIEKINYEKHKNIMGQPDIFIKPNICIFVDGCYFHYCQEQSCKTGNRQLLKSADSIQSKNIKNDSKVNHFLNEYGYNVIRIWEHTILNNSMNASENILQLIKTTIEQKRGPS